MELILIRGLPGSGKSTFAEDLCATVDCMIHLEADQYFENESGVYEFKPARIGFAHMWCQSECLKYLNTGMDVIVSNTFTTKQELKPYFDIAKQFNIIPIVIHCQNNFGSVHNVPEETIKKMKARWEHDISELFEGIK